MTDEPVVGVWRVRGRGEDVSAGTGAIKRRISQWIGGKVGNELGRNGLGLSLPERAAGKGNRNRRSHSASPIAHDQIPTNPHHCKPLLRKLQQSGGFYDLPPLIRASRNHLWKGQPKLDDAGVS